MPENFSTDPKPVYENKYEEFVANHHTALRRAGVATFIAGIPLGAVFGAEFNDPATSMMGIMGVGVIEYSLGVSGRDVEAWRRRESDTRQQGSDTVE